MGARNLILWKKERACNPWAISPPVQWTSYVQLVTLNVPATPEPSFSQCSGLPTLVTLNVEAHHLYRTQILLKGALLS